MPTISKNKQNKTFKEPRDHVMRKPNLVSGVSEGASGKVRREMGRTNQMEKGVSLPGSED